MDTVWKDLSAWQKEISKKDEALLRSKPVHDKALPAIRQPVELVLDNLKPVGLDSLKKTTPVKAPVNTSSKPSAEAEKAKGNEYFGKKDFKNAIIYYGKAIDLDPTVPVYFVNRAMAYLKLNKYLEAEKDCTRGIQLAPKNVKAFWRRGIARRELGRLVEAKKDFEMGLSIEPNNASLKDELKKLPVVQQPKKPVVQQVKEPVIKQVEQKRRLSINVIDQSYSEKVNKPSVLNTNKAPVSGPKIIELAPKTMPAISTPPPKPVQQIKITSPVKFTCPRTNFEFERDWKTYKSRSDDLLYQYFQCIPPSSYATLFKSSLESDQFEKIIELMKAKKMPAQEAFNVLEGLSQVKRIDMLVMFLSKKHQQVIGELFDMIKSSSIVPSDKLKKVSKVYGARI